MLRRSHVFLMLHFLLYIYNIKGKAFSKDMIYRLVTGSIVTIKL
jgi:hypothetical protein